MKKDTVLFISIFLFLIVFICFIDSLHGKKEEDYHLKIYFFQAGKADAIVLEQNDHVMMIDTGEESLKDDILSYFNEHFITKLDYLIITHFDKDHVGSAASILEEIEVEQVLQSNVPKNSEYYENYIEALKEKNIHPYTVSGDYSISFGDVEVVVNGPDSIYDSNESNNSSLIVSVKDQDNSFLFMGDAQNARIKDFLSTNEDFYQFLKVPYHGHYLKELANVLKSKKIKQAVITSSDQEKEDVETIELLKKNKISYYLTRNGSVIVLSDGKDIVIKQ